MADEQYKIPSVSESWEQKRQQWAKQLEGSISSAEAPKASAGGIWGLPLRDTSRFLDNIFTRAMHPVLGVIGAIRDVQSGQNLWGTIFQELPSTTQQRMKDEAEIAVGDAARAQTMSMLYESLPLAQLSPNVNSFEDYQEQFALDTSLLSPQDIAEARDAVEEAISHRGLGDTTLPDWLQVPEEDAATIKAFMEQPEQTRTPISLSMMTVEEVTKALHAIPVVQMPQGMTVEEMLQTMTMMGLLDKPETLKEIVDIDASVRVFRDAAIEQSQMIADIKAGLKDWEPPDQSFWQEAFFMVQSPLQEFANFLQPYIENVNQPLAGLAVNAVQRLRDGDQGLEVLYAKAREEGMSPWEAAKEAYVDWEAPWYQKLLIELATDPLTYVGTPLLTVAGNVLTKLGLKTAGRALISFNRAWYIATDIPFDILKEGQKAMLKTTTQVVKRELDDFNSLLWMSVERKTGKLMSTATPDDVAKALRECLEDYAKAPGTVSIKTTAKLGEMLSEHTALTGNKVWSWSKKYNGVLATANTVDNVSPLAVSEVNQILREATAKKLSANEAASMIAQALGIERNTDNLAKLVTEIPTFTKGLANSIDNALRVGKSASYRQTHKMIEYLNAKQKGIILAREVGKAAKGSTLEGIALGLQRGVDRIENHRIRMAIDRWVVRPFAEANLGSISYPIMNAFEGFVVSIIEGVVPRTTKLESFLMMTKGLAGDPALASRLASDVAGIMGGAPHRKGGVWTFFPKWKVPEKVLGVETPKFIAGREMFHWFGRAWIDLSNTIGNAQRQNFVLQRMSRHLAEKAYQESGGDFMHALERIIGEVPEVSKKTLGMTKDDLRNEVFRRVSVGSSEVKELLDTLNNGSLQKAEALKILRAADNLSPRARTLGEQLIEEGTVLRDPKSIENFSKRVADTAIEDINRMPIDLGMHFKELAGTIDGLTLTDATQLLDIFTTYEVMSSTANFIPHRIMSRTMEEADILYQAGAFRKVEQLWARSRKEMLEAMDEISTSMAQVRAKLQGNIQLLKPKARAALNSVLDRADSADMIRQATLQSDADMMNAFFSAPRAERTNEMFMALRAERAELWGQYRVDVANAGAAEWLARKDMSDLYHNLPKPNLKSVDASARDLTPLDIASVFGVNVDGLCSGIVDNLSLHGKDYFVELVQQSADRNPTLFKGFTHEKISSVYDNLLAQAKLRPELDIPIQKVKLQAENLRQELISLRMRHSMSSKEEKAMKKWLNGVAKERDKLVVKKNPGPGQITQERWTQLRQESLDAALNDYYKAFADYTNENIVAGTMKMIFPYWTYETYRWFGLLREGIRHPGLPLAWGKYSNYSENGYIPTPIPDIEMNPFAGTQVGTTFSLTRRDFASYYSSLGYVGEMFEYMQRWGFYPGAHIMGPVSALPYLQGRKMELAEILPPVASAALDFITMSPNKTISQLGMSLKDKIFHENFHNYYTATLLSAKQVEAEGTLIDGLSGAEVWMKLQRGEKLTPEEQELWDESYRKASKYGLLRSQFPQFRLKTEEYKDAYNAVTKIFEEQLGMSEEYQKELWRQHMQPSDVVALPLETQRALDELWQWKIFFGRGTILMPPDVADLKILQDKYYKRIESYQNERLTLQAEADNGFFTPTTENALNGAQWRAAYGANWNNYVVKVEGLESEDEFQDAIEAMTPEGRQAIAERLGFSIPPDNPLEEAIQMYFDIELREFRDPYTGEVYEDYQDFWARREAVRMALTDEQRAEFDKHIKKYQTPMERTWKFAYNTYIRGYKASSGVVFSTYEENEKKLIREYYSELTSAERKEEIRQALDPKTGKKLIAGYEAKQTQVRTALREMSPELDFWLLTFGYVTAPRTDQAKAMFYKYDQDRAGLIGLADTWEDSRLLMPTDKSQALGVVESAPELEEIPQMAQMEEPKVKEDGILKKAFVGSLGTNARLGLNFAAGVGGILTSIGGVMQRYDKGGEGLVGLGEYIQNWALEDMAPAEDVGQELADQISQALPFTVGAIALAAGSVGAAGALGLGTVGSWVVGTLLGTVVSRPLESAIEGGGTYLEALKRGMSPEEAQKAYDSVVKDNMRLAGLDAVQIATSFMPFPAAKAALSPLIKTAIIAGKLVVVGLTEGGEEAYQLIAQRKALGDHWYWEPQKWDDEQKMVFAVGSLMGVGMGTAGDIITKGKDVRPVAPDVYDEVYEQSVVMGNSEDVAAAEAIMAVAQAEPERTQMVMEVVERDIMQEGADVMDEETVLRKLASEEITSWPQAYTTVLQRFDKATRAQRVYQGVPDAKRLIGALDMRKESDRVRAGALISELSWNNKLPPGLDMAATRIKMYAQLLQTASPSDYMRVVVMGNPPDINPQTTLRTREEVNIAMLVDSYNRSLDMWNLSKDNVKPRDFKGFFIPGEVANRLGQGVIFSASPGSVSANEFRQAQNFLRNNPDLVNALLDELSLVYDVSELRGHIEFLWQMNPQVTAMNQLFLIRETIQKLPQRRRVLGSFLDRLTAVLWMDTDEDVRLATSMKLGKDLFFTGNIIPEAHIHSLVGLQYKGKEEDVTSDGTAVGYCYYKDTSGSHLDIYRGATPFTLAHEIGHNVYFELKQKSTMYGSTREMQETMVGIEELYKKYRADPNFKLQGHIFGYDYGEGPGFVYWYASTNADEFFACSYASYVKERRTQTFISDIMSDPGKVDNYTRAYMDDDSTPVRIRYRVTYRKGDRSMLSDPELQREAVEYFVRRELPAEHLGNLKQASPEMYRIMERIFAHGEWFMGNVQGTGGTQTSPQVAEPTQEVFREKTDMSYYDSLLDKPEYAAKNKDMTLRVVRMSPKRYIELTTEMQGSTTKRQVRMAPFEKVSRFAEQMRSGTKFDMPMLDYKDNLQEGRARALAAKELGVQSIPVLIADSASNPKAPQDLRVPTPPTEQAPSVAKQATEGKPTSIVGYRQVDSEREGQVGAGTFYYQSESQNLAVKIGEETENTPKEKVELSFTNPLVVPQSEIDFTGLPSESLFRKWFPDEYAKISTQVAKHQDWDFSDIMALLDRHSKLMDRKVAEQAVSLGYDGIIYGESEIQDLRDFRRQ